jgi:hypothetical protein
VPDRRHPADPYRAADPCWVCYAVLRALTALMHGDTVAAVCVGDQVWP